MRSNSHHFKSDSIVLKQALAKLKLLFDPGLKSHYHVKFSELLNSNEIIVVNSNVYNKIIFQFLSAILNSYVVHFIHVLQCVHIEFHALQMCFAGVYIWEWDYAIKGTARQTQNWACFVFLKSIEKILEINVGILKQSFEKLKYAIRISVDHMVRESLVKTCQILFQSIDDLHISHNASGMGPIYGYF